MVLYSSKEREETCGDKMIRWYITDKSDCSRLLMFKPKNKTDKKV